MRYHEIIHQSGHFDSVLVLELNGAATISNSIHVVPIQRKVAQRDQFVNNLRLKLDKRLFPVSIGGLSVEKIQSQSRSERQLRIRRIIFVSDI
jgi:hypothetical protein